MTAPSRIIWIGKNSQMAVAPRSATSAGVTPAARLVVLPRGRAALPSLPPARLLPSRGNWRSSPAEGAPLFDATADKWIVPPSGMTPDAGASADPGHTSVSTLPSPAGDPPPAGRLEVVMDVVTTALGLTVFGLIAGFFLVMA